MMAETRTRTHRSSRTFAPNDVEEETSLIDQREGIQVEVVNKEYEIKRDRLLSILEPGDHIAAKRKKGLYEHHGIYEGEEKGYPSVIHFQGPGKSSANPLVSCNTCGYEHPKEAKVVISCIDCFSQGERMYKLQYMLQNKLLSSKDTDSNELTPGKLIKGYRSRNKSRLYLEHYKGKELHGHSSVSIKKRKRSEDTPYDQVRFYKKLSSRSSEQVLNEAREFNSKPYSVFCHNCEHFAVFCKTGNGMSKQVKNRYLTFLCKVPRCLGCFATTESSDSENECRNMKPEAEESEKEEDEDKGLFDSGNARRRKRMKKT